MEASHNPAKPKHRYAGGKMIHSSFTVVPSAWFLGLLEDSITTYTA